jgi:single-strand DNA-binding protein
MAAIAKVTLIGNLGRDPETRYTPSGALNVQFTVATNRRWTDQSGQQQERTTWFRVTAWRRLAEVLVQLSEQGALTKGKQVYVYGSLEAREYQDQNNQTRTSLDVTADDFLLLGSRQDFDGGMGSGRATGAGRSDSADFESPNDIEDVPF